MTSLIISIIAKLLGVGLNFFVKDVNSREALRREFYSLMRSHDKDVASLRHLRDEWRNLDRPSKGV